MSYYGIDPSEVEAHAVQLAKDERSSDHTSVVQSLKHFVRDWSVDGDEERAAVLPQILETLEVLFPGRKRKVDEVRVLIPGSGLGRLGVDVDGLGGEYLISISMLFAQCNKESADSSIVCRF